MHRRLSVALVLAALAVVTPAVPGGTPHAAAASCSDWTSETQPPPTIRVFRHVTGAVETVDFRAYAANVLSREWISSWTTESLRSGALAVKHYAWYQVLHWRGGTNAGDACFDVRDDTYDQVYDPERPTWASAAAAVDATWTTRVLKNGRIFPTYYNAGGVGEACGANANGWRAYQWGTQACGLAGKTAAQIMAIYYYPGVSVTDAPPRAPTGTPAPTATPAPSATPAAPTATPAPTASPAPSAPPAQTAPSAPGASPTPQPTPLPAPLATPAPTPAATTPAPGERPGGGQAGLAAAATPPPPPPDNPVPVVAVAAVDAVVAQATVAADRRPIAMARLLEWALPDDARGHGSARAGSAPGARPTLQLLAFRTVWDATVDALVTELRAALGGRPSGIAGLDGGER